jgi:hypothetical protein
VIPKSVISIGDGAFAGCTTLTAITVDDLNPGYSSVDGVLFDKTQTTLAQYPSGKAGPYTIPIGVTNIGNYGFYSCNSLTSVTIADTVTSIGNYAFYYCTGLGSVTMPSSVTNIGSQAFYGCGSLISLAIPDKVTSIGDGAFSFCTSLTTVVIGNGVTNIGTWFDECSRLTTVTIGNGVESIDDWAFFSFTSLNNVEFKGNAPSLGLSVFAGDKNATVYYLPGTTGWGTNYGGLPTALWLLPKPLVLNYEPNFGVKANRFGFIISWATNVPVVVEASTSLVTATWSPISTNTLTSGSAYFSDPQWTNFPARFYRIRSP